MDEFDVVVIGAGPGGYVAAIRAAQLGLKTACVEKRKDLGGTCLQVGCIPSKTLLHASELYQKLEKEGSHFGIHAERISFNWEKMLLRKEEVIKGLQEGIKALFKKNKVTLYTGTASFETPYTVRVEGAETKTLSAKYIILATGSEPIQLPFLPFDENKVLSSTGALSLKQIPKKLLVIGAGAIGLELGSVYQRLGSEVCFVEFMDRICPGFDSSLSKSLQEVLEKQGLKFLLSSKVTGAEVSKQVTLHVQTIERETKLEADAVLVSVGRKPYTQSLNLDKAGVFVSEKGAIKIDANFRTTASHIFAIGDIVDGPMLAHKASEEGVAAAEILAGHKPTLSYLSIPNVVYTSPEAASVGFSEEEAKKWGLTYKTGTFSFKACPRSRCTGEDEGFVKILSESHTDKIIGVHILGPHASELIAEAALAIERGETALELGSLCHAHPTYSEALKEAALSIHKRAIHR